MEDIQRGVFKTLSSDADLIDALGGVHVYDRLPDRTKPPYIVIGDVSSQDWSTFTEAGEELTFLVHTWSKTADRRQSLDLVERVKVGLTSSLTNLADHHLVNLRNTFAEVRRDISTGLLHGFIRFRAVVEPKTQ